MRDRCCGQLCARKALGTSGDYIHCNDMFFGDLALGEVMGIRSQHLLVVHIARFTASVLALLAVPVVGMAPLPVSGAARLLTALSMIAVCCMGALAFAWGNVRKWALRTSENRRWGHALFALLLADVSGALIVAGLMHNENLVTRAGIVVVCGVLLFGGAWALGGLLQFLWRVTTPPQPPARRARIIRGRALHGGVSRG